MNTYLNAISALAPLSKPEHWVKFSTRLAIADACMAVADAEQAELKADVKLLTKRLQDVVDEVQKRDQSQDGVRKLLTVERDKARAEVERLHRILLKNERDEAHADDVANLMNRQLVVLRERDEALATIERVKALVDEGAGYLSTGRVRYALTADPEPKPDLHHAGCQINSQHWCQHCGHRWPCPTNQANNPPTEPGPAPRVKPPWVDQPHIPGCCFDIDHPGACVIAHDLPRRHWR